MVFEGTGKGKRKDAGKQAQKLSAVKKKREDPKFKQQQRQNSGNDATNQGGTKIRRVVASMLAKAKARDVNMTTTATLMLPPLLEFLLWLLSQTLVSLSSRKRRSLLTASFQVRRTLLILLVTWVLKHPLSESRSSNPSSMELRTSKCRSTINTRTRMPPSQVPLLLHY